MKIQEECLVQQSTFGYCLESDRIYAQSKSIMRPVQPDDWVIGPKFPELLRMSALIPRHGGRGSKATSVPRAKVDRDRHSALGAL